MEALIVIAVAGLAGAAAWAFRGRTTAQPAGTAVDTKRGRARASVAGVMPVSTPSATATGAPAAAPAATSTDTQPDPLRSRRDEVLRLEERIMQREEAL